MKFFGFYADQNRSNQGLAQKNAQLLQILLSVYPRIYTIVHAVEPSAGMLNSVKINMVI